MGCKRTRGGKNEREEEKEKQQVLFLRKLTLCMLIKNKMQILKKRERSSELPARCGGHVLHPGSLDLTEISGDPELTSGFIE